jgi:hypothetical protein
MMQRYSMMKEIFVYIVGMKLKKQHYDKNTIIFTVIFRVGNK